MSTGRVDEEVKGADEVQSASFPPQTPTMIFGTRLGYESTVSVPLLWMWEPLCNVFSIHH